MKADFCCTICDVYDKNSSIQNVFQFIVQNNFVEFIHIWTVGFLKLFFNGLTDVITLVDDRFSSCMFSQASLDLRIRHHRSTLLYLPSLCCFRKQRRSR